MNTYEAAHLTEDQARTYLEAVRWPNGPVCAHCQATDRQSVLKGAAHRKGLKKCGYCRKQYSVTVNTVMHKSHLPLAKWVYAFHVLCDAKKGKSACELQRALGMKSYRTAWHMAHRIRLAMQESPLKEKLRGVVEADETFVGGKPRRGSNPNGKGGPAPDFKDRKTPVFALVQRDGKVIAHVMKKVSSENLRKSLKKHVHWSATLNTDERPQYRKLGRNFQRHESVNHLSGEYSRLPGIHVNSCESFFAGVKRAMYGTHHHVSKKLLPLYIDEAVFRWNFRKALGTERAEAALRGVTGKRLQYAAS